MADRPGPLCFRPPDDLREWVLAESGRTGQPVSVILASALRVYRELLAGRLLR